MMTVSADHWKNVPISKLAQHVEQSYHEPLRQELLKLDVRMAVIAGSHGLQHCKLEAVASAFVKLEEILRAHLEHLPPLLQRLERTEGSSEQELREFTAATDQLCELLQDMRQLADDYRQPQDGCEQYREVLTDLATLERDLREYLDIETTVVQQRSGAAASDAEPAK